MTKENAGNHAWIPVVVAIITSLAAIGAAYIGADAKSQLRELTSRIEKLGSELSSARADLATCREKEKEGATDKRERPSAEGGQGTSRPQEPPDPRPQTLRVRIRVPPGYDQAAVYLDGTLRPVATRSLYWLELDAPNKSEPTFVRLEAKGRPICEKLVHLRPSREGIAIC